MYYKIPEAKSLMNRWGRKRSPFLFITDFELKKIVLIPEEELNKYPIKFEMEDAYNTTSQQTESSAPFISFKRIPADVYQKAFDLVQEHIHHGNTYLINLTFKSELETDLSLEQIFEISKAKYKLYWKDELVVFSPETFVKIKDNRIQSNPMKGTIDANQENAAQLLLEDKKELAEHYTIVDLIRNDLNRVAKSVHLGKFRYFDTIKSNNKTLLQTSTEILGTLRNGWNKKLGDIIFELLPAGSISGAPKSKTLQIIKEAELDSRGFYTGVFGYFDGKTLDSAVMIRFIEADNGKLYYRSGGGITSSSKWEMEYQELQNKIYVPIV